MKAKIFVGMIVLCLITSSIIIYMITGCSMHKPSGIASLRISNTPADRVVSQEKRLEDGDLKNKPGLEGEKFRVDETGRNKAQNQVRSELSWVPTTSGTQSPEIKEPAKSESSTPDFVKKYRSLDSSDSYIDSTNTKPSSQSQTYTPSWSDTGSAPSRTTLDYTTPGVTPPGGTGGYGAADGMMGGYGGGMMGGGARGSVPIVGDVPIVGSLFRSDGSGRGPTQPVRTGPLLNINADEVWIIAKVDNVRRVVSDDIPGTGSMLARLPQREKEIPLPLKHTDVKGDICGYIATVDVTQQFQNPYSEKIEASYVFPLPDNAAVNEFIMTIGERKIRGIIRERQEAEQIYEQARSQGYVASLLTQERPNIFTQKVANIEPNKQIDVNIKYFSTLAYVDGWYEFVFPMVVGPRYNPPGTTDGVGAVAHGRTGVSGQDTEVQYLKPNERSGHDISLAVNIDAGVAIEEVKCTSHVIRKSNAGEEKLSVELSKMDSIPNKDFVLRYRVAGNKVKSALVIHQDKRGGYFSLMLYPPENLTSVRRAPMEMIFVLDTSGSMNGKPIEKSKDAACRALRQLQPGDTFQIIRFANETTQLGPQPIPATQENIRRGFEYVQNLSGAGGTEMIQGVRAALDFSHDPERFRLVSFMTDGYIGNEADILEAVHDKLGASRIFSFGVGTSVNRYLLDRMAVLGKGAVAYIGLEEDAGDIIDLFYERISHPALTDVKIDWGGLEVSEMYPSQIPDLFVGRPVIVTGKFKGSRDATIRISGNVGNKQQEIKIAANFEDSASTHPGIACVWARKQIETLANQATYNNNSDLPFQIRQVALEYGLMSNYTAFIAVDSSRQTSGDHGITVNVPVPVPYGVRYDTTVQK
jgi:Ca-activated chloride channel homolog